MSNFPPRERFALNLTVHRSWSVRISWPPAWCSQHPTHAPSTTSPPALSSKPPPATHHYWRPLILHPPFTFSPAKSIQFIQTLIFLRFHYHSYLSRQFFSQLERKILGRHLTASVLHSARGSAPIPLLSANPFVSCPHFSQLVPTLMIAPYGGHIMASLFFCLIITLDAFSAVFRYYSLSNFSRLLSAACEDQLWESGGGRRKREKEVRNFNKSALREAYNVTLELEMYSFMHACPHKHPHTYKLESFWSTSHLFGILPLQKHC